MGKPSSTRVSVAHTNIEMPRLQRKKNKKLKQAGTPELATGVQKGLGKPKRGKQNKKNHCCKNKKAGLEEKINVLNNKLNNILEESSKSEKSLHSLSNTVIQAKNEVNKTKRNKNRHNNKINKRFDKLINNLQESLGTSITSIDSTEIEQHVPNIKRKGISIVSDSPRKKSRQSISATSIVIKDDDDHNTAHCSKLKIKPPLHCSTPIKTLLKNSPSTLVTIDLSEDGNPTVVNEPKDGDNLNSDEDKKTDSDCAFVTEINKTVISKEAGDKEISDCVFVSEINKTDTEDRSNEVKGNEVSDCVFISDDQDKCVLESGEIAETSDPDCVFVSAHNSTDSDDSDVTIIPNQENLREKKIRKVVRGLAKLDESAKDKLLRLITQNIFTGCKTPKKFKNLTRKAPNDLSIQATEDDMYIKEVILRQSLSRSSVGSNIYNPAHVKRRTGLRMVVIDGSNVAMSHGQHRFFSVKGLKICIDYFTRRGHAVKAFVPRFRCKFGKSTNPRLLDYLENQGLVVYTPSREIQGRHITSYDDRYIIQCAAEFDGVIVSGDNYRDLINENPKWRFIIENRLLPFTFVDDMIMFPKDPLGRNGPSLQTLLRH